MSDLADYMGASDTEAEILDLKAEIERLQAALTYIAYPQYDDRKYELMAAARAALEGGDG